MLFSADALFFSIDHRFKNKNQIENRLISPKTNESNKQCNARNFQEKKCEFEQLFQINDEYYCLQICDIAQKNGNKPSS